MLKATPRKHDEISILDLQGTVDLDGVAVLKESISNERKAGCKKMIINMQNVDKIVSTVLNALQSTITAFWATQGSIILINVSTGNLRTLQQKEQFFNMFSVADSEEDAIRQLSG